MSSMKSSANKNIEICKFRAHNNILEVNHSVSPQLKPFTIHTLAWLRSLSTQIDDDQGIKIRFQFVEQQSWDEFYERWYIAFLPTTYAAINFNMRLCYRLVLSQWMFHSSWKLHHKSLPGILRTLFEFLDELYKLKSTCREAGTRRRSQKQSPKTLRSSYGGPSWKWTHPGSPAKNGNFLSAPGRNHHSIFRTLS